MLAQPACLRPSPAELELALFEELDYQPTPLGPLILRRRWIARAGAHALEIKLGDAFLMSSLFTASEVALAEEGVAAVGRSGLSVVVGGLGLGCTARAALDSGAVDAMIVVEFLPGVIGWHRDGLLPLGPGLFGDPRCRIVEDDFFARALSQDGFDPDRPGRRFDAILLDIDHTPDRRLGAQSDTFYTTDGLARVAQHLAPGGAFGVWSDAGTDPAFVRVLEAGIGPAQARPVTFHNPLRRCRETQTVYLARAEGGA